MVIIFLIVVSLILNIICLILIFNYKADRETDFKLLEMKFESMRVEVNYLNKAQEVQMSFNNTTMNSLKKIATNSNIVVEKLKEILKPD